MIYTTVNTTNILEVEAAAMLLREIEYSNYKRAKYDVEKTEKGVIVKLYNSESDKNSEGEYHKLYKEVLQNEIERTQYIIDSTKGYLKDYMGLIKMFHDMPICTIENIGSFSCMGGIAIVGGNTRIEIRLNYLDLYDIKIFKNSELVREFKDIYFDQLVDVLI